MKRKPGIAILLLCLSLIIYSIRSAEPPAITEESIADSSFSAKRAYAHLQQVARKPHSIGTEEHKIVCEYILSSCIKLGIEAEIQHTTALTTEWGNVTAAEINNVVARIKGIRNSKAILLMVHYDSQPNTPGAGDDGAGVAAILETIRALKKLPPLQNDIILLFTDGEEIGLMGADAFVKESLLMKEIGVVINFEGRGNAGISNMFEVNPENGWVVNEYTKAVPYPAANSLAYEIYKTLPNNTDYTIFKKAGITGLNNAHIDGFVNYHSMTDKAESLDPRTLQHHGDNMLALVKHFGNLTITTTKGPDISYFNIIGNWFIHYPASRNLACTILTNILFIILLIIGVRKKRITIKGFFAGLFSFLAVLILTYFIGSWLLKGILSGYPLYSHFYENNSYNSSWYFLAMSAASMFIFGLVYYWLAKKFSMDSLVSGILMVITLLTNLMQFAMPSASYLLFVPLLFVVTGNLILYSRNIQQENHPLTNGLVNLASTVPSILILAPTIYFTFVAFGLGGTMPFVLILLSLLTGLLMPLLYPVLKNNKLLFPITAAVCFIIAMTGGHFQSDYSEKYPLQTNLYYTLDADSNKAIWASDFSAIDKFTAPFFKEGKNDTSENRYRPRIINSAPLLTLSPAVVTVTRDTVENNKRKLLLHFSPSREGVISMNIKLSGNSQVDAVFVNEKEAKKPAGNKESPWKHSINFSGFSKAGFSILFEMNDNSKLEFSVTDRSMGLPEVNGFTTIYPKDIIPGADYNSNTIQVKKRFAF